MALKDTWKDKQDGDYISAEDLNMIAGTVIDLENNQDPGSGGNGSSIIVDDKMSDESTNAVQNKVVKKYVDSAVKEQDEEILLLESTATGAKEKAEEALSKAEEALNKPGQPGKSAYEIACDNGFEGSEEEWLESLGGGTLSATIVDGVLILNSKSNTKYTSSINNGILIIK